MKLEDQLAKNDSKAGAGKRKRGRPLSFDREIALEKAMLLFWQFGYEATSVSDLVGAMGISAPSLYATFGSKEQLFMESIRRYEASNGCAMQEIFGNAPTARIAVELFLQRSAVLLTQPAKPHGCMIVTAATNCSSESAHVQTALAERRQESGELILARLHRGVREGDLPQTADIERLAAFYSAVAQGMTIQARDGATAEVLAEIGKMAMAAWPKS